MHLIKVYIFILKITNMQISCNIVKSTKNSAGIFRFFYVTACLLVFTQQPRCVSQSNGTVWTGIGISEIDTDLNFLLNEPFNTLLFAF